MAGLLNPRHEHFCRLVASGQSPAQAYVGAGYSEQSAYTSGPRLRKMAAVTTKNVLHKAAQEVQEHPIASLAAAITAAAALVRVLSSEHQHQQR